MADARGRPAKLLAAGSSLSHTGGVPTIDDEWPPPWIALPGLDPHEPATHGMPEAYIGLNWLPFWLKLTPEEKAAYLDRWHATPEWRKAIVYLYDNVVIDWAEEARCESEAVAQLRATKKKRPWWRRWF